MPTAHLQDRYPTPLGGRATVSFDLLEMATKCLTGFAVRDMAHLTEVGGLAPGTRVPVAVLFGELGLSGHSTPSEF